MTRGVRLALCSKASQLSSPRQDHPKLLHLLFFPRRRRHHLHHLHHRPHHCPQRGPLPGLPPDLTESIDHPSLLRPPLLGAAHWLGYLLLLRCLQLSLMAQVVKSRATIGVLNNHPYLRWPFKGHLLQLEAADQHHLCLPLIDGCFHLAGSKID